MITEAKFRELKQAHESARTEAERAEGALIQLMSQLKSEFDCDTLEEAQEKLRKLQKQQAREQTELAVAIAEYEKKWNHD
jgi:hypothetical protein